MNCRLCHQPLNDTPFKGNAHNECMWNWVHKVFNPNDYQAEVKLENDQEDRFDDHEVIAGLKPTT